jgi:hypothetical protein
MRRGALRSALSERLREGNLIVIDDFSIANPKTKDFLSALSTLGLIENKKRAKTLIVDSLDNANLILSSRNVQKTKVTNSFGLNIYDLLYHEKLVISKSAVEELNHLLDPHREKGGNDNDAAETVTAETVTAETPKPKKQAKAKTEAAPAEEPAVDKAPVAENDGGETAVEDNPNTGEVATETTSETEKTDEEATQ